MVQNMVAKWLFNVRYLEHITPLLFQLHWHLIQFWIRLKVLLLIFKALKELGSPVPIWIYLIIKICKRGPFSRSHGTKFRDGHIGEDLQYSGTRTNQVSSLVNINCFGKDGPDQKACGYGYYNAKFLNSVCLIFLHLIATLSPGTGPNKQTNNT